MGLLNTLISKIFSYASAPAAAAAPQSAPASAPVSTAPTAAAAPSASAPAQPVDVAATLNALAAKNPEKLDWKHSIVDLMKLVGMDSSLSARKELAKDLHYTGDQSDSATMNMWLHKEVLRKLSENGGKVPADLLDK
jgi:3-oxoacyl-ACP reductase-like protein